MGAKATADIVTRVITLTTPPVLENGDWVVDIDVKTDLYSALKADWRASSNLRRLRMPIYAVGGNALPGSKSLGSTYFLRSDWTILPYNSDHRLRINGNFYKVDGTSPFTAPASANIFLEQTVSSLVDSTVQQLQEIEYSSFNGGVSIDVINGGVGTDYPMGTPQSPVDNLADAITIAESRGFKTLLVLESMTLADETISNFVLRGRSEVLTTITLADSLVCDGVTIEDCYIEGILDGGTHISFCAIGDLTYVNGIIQNCSLQSTITLAGNDDAMLSNCVVGNFAADGAIIDMGGSGQNVLVTDWSGKLTFKNSTGSDKISVQIDGGQVILDPTINGTNYIGINGVGLLTDNATAYASLQTDGLMNKATIADAVSDEIGEEIQYAAYGAQVYISTAGSAGTVYPAGTPALPVDNLADAVTIATARGFDTLHFLSDWTFPNGTVLGQYQLIGEGIANTTFTCEAGSIFGYCSVSHATITGSETGIIEFQNAKLIDLGSVGLAPSSIDILVQNCLYEGEVSIPSNYSGVLTVIDCWALPDVSGNPPVLDMGNSTASVQFRNWSGLFTLKNCTEAIDIRVFIASGGLTLDSTVTAGNFLITGVGILTDNSTSVTSLNTEGLMNKTTVADAVEVEIGSEIQYSSFGNGVTIDVINGTDGTDYPIGTVANPCKTIANAMTISQARGLTTLFVIGDLTLSHDDVPYYLNGTIIGRGPLASTITIDDIVFEKCVFRECTLTGTFGNGSSIETYTCKIEDLYNITMDAHECTLLGTIELNNSISSNFYDCTDGVPGYGVCTMQVNDCESLGLWGFSGGIQLTNIVTVGAVISVNLESGRLIVDSSDTAGHIIVRGTGSLEGTANGTVIDSDGLMNKATVSSAVWDEAIGNHLIPDSMGHEMYHVAYGDVVHVNAVTGVAGTTFPTGTTHQPCDNLADALSIAGTHNIGVIHIEGAITIDGEDLTGYVIAADRSLGNSVSITSMVNTGACYFQDITVSGNLTGSTRFTNCVMGVLAGFDGGAKNSLLTGTVTITGAGANYFTECDTYITDPTNPVELNVGSATLNIITCRGGYKITNKTSTNTLALNLVAGIVEVASSCTAGIIQIGGTAKVTDNSGAGCTVIAMALDNDLIAATVWNVLTADMVTADSVGVLLKAIAADAVDAADIAAIQSNLTIINNGVQKASLLQPHRTDTQ